MSSKRVSADSKVVPEIAEFVTVSAFSKRTSASHPTVRVWIAQGMPAIRADHRWRIDLHGALRWLRELARPAGSTSPVSTGSVAATPAESVVARGGGK